MTWKCFFFGCKWRPFIHRIERGECLRTDLCQRCNGFRTVSQ